MSKRKAPAVSSERLQFVKAIESFSKAAENVTSTATLLNDLPKKLLVDLDQSITEKKTQLAELEEEFAHDKKRRCIELAQEVQEFGYQKAVEILGARGEEPISSQKLADLRKDLEENEEASSKEMDEALKKLEARMKAERTMALQKATLEHEKNTAVLKAEGKRLADEIKQYTATIEMLKEEIKAQRQLTKEVADAGRSGAITQSFGK